MDVVPSPGRDESIHAPRVMQDIADNGKFGAHIDRNVPAKKENICQMSTCITATLKS